MQTIFKNWYNFLNEKSKRQVASTFVIDSDDKVLIIRRTKTAPSKPGSWEIPGGRMDPEDKDAKETAKRETQEETGLSVDNLISVSVEETDNKIKHYYTTRDYSGNVSLDPNPKTDILEHDDYKWVSTEEIEELGQQTTVDVYLLKKAISHKKESNT